MLHHAYIQEDIRKLGNGDVMKGILIPEGSYDIIRSDFSVAEHLGAIEEFDADTAQGAFIKCGFLNDGLHAAVYLYKKIEEAVMTQTDPGSFSLIPDPDDEDVDFIYSEGDLSIIPVVDIQHVSPMAHPAPAMPGQGQPSVTAVGPTPTYWAEHAYPLIVVSDHPLQQQEISRLKSMQRLLILVVVDGSIENLEDDGISMTPEERNFLFETEFELCPVSKPNREYYEILMRAAAKERGFVLSKKVNEQELLERLIRYRGERFSSHTDVIQLLNQVIRKRKRAGKTLTSNDFEQVFHGSFLDDQDMMYCKPDMEILDQLVGLDGVKERLSRIIMKKKFNQHRAAQGFPTEQTHVAAAFMGSPGTAKTTVARRFCEILCQEGLLDNPTFLEVTRKDLVGKYVGWTAAAVSQIFSQAKGGTIFIDEAYSLYNPGGKDAFADEAVTEVILNMENNPDTLVIFAGYTDKMKVFIEEANPGLRSRLTELVEFPDYQSSEMAEIFVRMAEHEAYQLEDSSLMRMKVAYFVDQLQDNVKNQSGNARLIRKLFKSTLGFMAERMPTDVVTINVEDLDQATRELLDADKLLSSTEKQNPVGFIAS